ncbi:hypothetical protein BY458DRAFT_438834 [Sporodiniella umbellata]|nr:hypothetical protein BY458DRAFT_438834 [Sporodiniella umbellata]
MNHFLGIPSNVSKHYQTFIPNFQLPKAIYIYFLFGLLMICYLGLVRHLRYKNLKYIREKYPDPDLILKDSKAAAEVMSITASKEFVKIGLLKTFTTPGDSKMLVATKQFSKETKRRFEDTFVITTEIFDTPARIGKQLQENPQTPQKDIDRQWQRWDEAIEQMNLIHSFYNIKNINYKHTLAVLTTEPILWALYRFWYDIAERMNIKEIPSSYEKLLECREDYINNNIRYCDDNKILLKSMIQMFVDLIPFSDKFLGLIFHIVPSFMHPKEAIALGLPQENKYISGIVYLLFRLRASFVRHFMLPRASFLTRTPFYPNPEGKYVPSYFMFNNFLYKNGYSISEVGPEKVVQKPRGCPFG